MEEMITIKKCVYVGMKKRIELFERLYEAEHSKRRELESENIALFADVARLTQLLEEARQK